MDEIIGIVKLFAGNFAPQNFLYCDGQILPISNNEALFSILGTTFGGNGTENFALPKLNAVPGNDGTELKYIISVNGLYPQRN